MMTPSPHHRSIAAGLLLAVCAAAAADDPDDVRLAAQKAVTLLQASAETYLTRRECYSCHHQTLPVMAFSLAKPRGVKVADDAMRRQSALTQAFFEERRQRVAKGQGVPGGPFTAGYALIGLAEDKWPADGATAALVSYLHATQEKDGRWRIRTRRPPIEDSDFTATALSVRALRLWSADEAATIDAVKRARQWLVNTTAESNEDKTFRLLGLAWSDAPRAAVESATRDLLADQRQGGGWRQIEDREPDAYATGQALAALHLAGGVKTTQREYRRGIAYLLRTQHDDGSWLVTTRSKPIQTYFESGFPHEKHQFISISGTSWATMALLLSLDGQR